MEIAISLMIVAVALYWIAWEIRETRRLHERTGLGVLTTEVRKVAILYSRYLKRYYPNVLKSNVPRDTIWESSTVEMSPEKFKELKYRTRMTPNEAAAYYEQQAAERLEKAGKQGVA